jgi:ATP-dependent DNA helicase RecG
MKSQQPAVPDLAQSLTALGGIGRIKADKYKIAFGVNDIEGLLRLLPKRYRPAPIVVKSQKFSEIDGEFVQIAGEIYSVSIFRMGYKRNILNVRIKIDDQKLCVAFFNQAFRKKQFVEGEKIAFEGVLCEKNGWQLTSAQVIDEADMQQQPVPQPIYAKGEGLPSKFVGESVKNALRYAEQLAEVLPDALLDAARVPLLPEAVRMVHAPVSLDEAELGRRRLALGELYSLHLQRHQFQRETAAIECREDVLQRVYDLLPFDLNDEQLQVIAELRDDLQSGKCMQRLLHGEVGSGKTAVAFVIALMVVAAGGQVAILAPTEILAHQHYLTFSTWLANTNTTVAHNQTNAHVVIGTHALLNEKVKFDNLRLVVFDEQQRFGVKQKASLVAKGVEPHVLTMTATPIPRTLAWSYYGALRPCVLEKRAGSNAKIVTKVFNDTQVEEQCEKLLPFLNQQQQVLIVVPRIDGEDGLLSWHEYLMGGVFKQFTSSLAHGRLDSEQVKTAVDDFRNKQTQILFGTTIVEVGIDIPNVQHLLVLDAQRLGLSSLHQLRGRLARGENASTAYCQLFTDNDESQQRLAVLETCDNGFEVAAADLKHRGPGAMLGTQQSGHGGFQSFDPVADSDLVQLIAEIDGNQAEE